MGDSSSSAMKTTIEEWTASGHHTDEEYKDKLDVAVGTFELDKDGSTVCFEFEKHWQRVIKEGPDLIETHDKGWQEMERVASLKWARLALSDSEWEVKVGEVTTGGNCILGVNIKQTRGGWDRGRRRQFPDENYEHAADEVLLRLGEATSVDMTKAQEYVLKAFRAADKDSSGGIDTEELHGILMAAGLEREEADACFKAVDANKDDIIDFDEFITWVFKKGDCDNAKDILLGA
eukprot:TRINITY_DN24037_c0_g1_i1.p1 TRINITY_DN24037_c0_g1~~TRINITY_DN24037_c0_g1_i1.p1  ORF type:complete len:234 (-),score=53.42 TRINITY_DN24037_c0_g1_i1:214-915(-)